LICYDETWTDAAVRRWLRRVSPELADDLYALGNAVALAKGRDATLDIQRIVELKARAIALVQHGAALSTRDLAVNGGDLMRELNLSPGRQVGELLKQLLEDVTEDPELNTREALIDRACRLSSSRPV
jgi:tRNA nucleotidyltransferase (CCA-adding enzyme)